MVCCGRLSGWGGQWSDSAGPFGGMLVCCIGMSGAGLSGGSRCRNDLVLCIYQVAGACAGSGHTLKMRV